LGRTRRELLESIDSDELSEWIAFDWIEPLPDPWAIGAQQAALFANAHSAKGSRTYRASDFIPKRRAEMTPAQIRAIMKMY
jgi:hypothetical protein